MAHPKELSSTLASFLPKYNVHRVFIQCALGNMHAKKKRPCYVDVILGVTYLCSVGLWCNILYLPCVHPKRRKGRKKKKKARKIQMSNTSMCVNLSTNVELVSSFLFYTILVCIMKIFTIFDTSRVWIFEDNFILNTICSIYHAETFIPR